MLCYYNVHVFKNRGKFSCIPEHHWVASSMIYTFYPTTFFQLGVYNTFLSIYLENAELNHVSQPKERDTSEVNEAIKEPFVQQVLFYWIVVVENLFANYTDSNFSCRCNCKLHSMLAPKSPTYSERKIYHLAKM